MTEGGLSRGRATGLAIGVLGFALLQLTPAPAGLSAAGWDTVSIAFLIAAWWLSEAIPLSATALLPLVLFPILGVRPVRDAAIAYANPIIMLMLSGFILALGMQRCGLHRRIALNLVSRVGTRPANLVGGFMLASALISMWIFNTTTAVMMLPIAVSVIEFGRRSTDNLDPILQERFATALMIGIAYGATIGGMGTLIGTAPNAVLAGFMSETYGIDVGFFAWMRVGIPMVAVMLPLTWLLLVRVAFPITAAPAQSSNVLAEELAALGPMSRAERRVAMVVVSTAILWIFRPLLATQVPGSLLNDTSIGLLGAMALFVTPVDWRRGEFALGEGWAQDLPWGVLLLFGGGLSLAAGIKASGLSEWIGSGATQLAGMPTLVVMLGLVVVMVLLTEITSNTATTATFLPIAGSVAVGIGEDPLLLVFPTVLAASCAFMMPVATPPNAVVFASGYIRIGQFVRAGVLCNLLGTALTLLAAYTIVRWAFGIELGAVPDWARGT